MLRFLARRLLAAVPLLLGVLTLIFLLAQAAPGDPFRAQAERSGRPGSADRLRGALGADRPAAARYAEWMSGFVTGDLGTSWSHRRPVGELLARAAPNTLRLATAALALQFLLGVGAGTLAAWRRGGWIDRAVRAAAVLLYSTPSYWIGLVLVALLAVRLGWLPASQMRSVDAASLAPALRWADAVRHGILPCLSLALPTAGGIALFVREEIEAAMRQPFVRAARARGASRGRVVVRHALRVSLLPVAALLGLALPGLLGGSVVVEALFAWPGLGRLAHQGVLAGDQPLILGCAAVGAALVIAGSLLGDLAAAGLDPRFRGEMR